VRETSSPEEGIGLAPPVSRKPDEPLGGSIDVESVPRRGSTLTVVLPQRRKAS